MTVSIRQAQITLADLIVRSANGEEVSVTNDSGKVVARIVAQADSPGRRPVLQWLDQMPATVHGPSEWAHIETQFQEERNSWDR